MSTRLLHMNWSQPLAGSFFIMELKKNVILKDYANYKIGGPADYFIEAKNIEELKGALNEANRLNLPIFVLGGGTNILVSDEGFRGLIIKIQDTRCKIKDKNIVASAGILMVDLVNIAAKNNLSGLEWAAGLPGAFGGAIRGNAGCFNGEMKDIIKETVSLYKRPPYQIIKRNNKECEFGYRSSIFKKIDNEIILEAKIILNPGDAEKIKELSEKNINYRLKNHPMRYPSAGSIFKNVAFEKIPQKFNKYFKQWLKDDPFPLVPAGIIIKEAGLAGKSVGGAKVSEKHANFIVNFDNAKARDVKLLIDSIKKTIKEKFNINLEEEIIYVGF